MRKILSTASVMAITAAVSLSAFAPVADAYDGRHMRNHNNYHGGYNRHRGRGHWRNGEWVALGVGAAIVGAAIANDNRCYWRHGHRYCD